MSVREAVQHRRRWRPASKPRSCGCIRPSWRRARAGTELESADGVIVPGGFGSRGIEGKIAAARYRPRTQRALPGAVPGDAGDGDRIRAARPGLGGRQLHRIRPLDAPSGDRLDARTARYRRHGRHHAPGAVPVPPRRLARWRRQPTARPEVAGAPPPPLRVQQHLPRDPGQGGAWSSPGFPRTGGWWRSPSSTDHPFMVGSQFHPEFLSRPNRAAPAVPRAARSGDGLRRSAGPARQSAAGAAASKLIRLPGCSPRASSSRGADGDAVRATP